MRSMPWPMFVMMFFIMILIGLTMLRAMGMFDAGGRSSAHCSRCQTNNPTYAKFCRRCGQALSLKK